MAIILQALKELAENMHLQNRSFPELCRDRVVKKVILADMVDVGKQEGLCSFEQVSFVHSVSFPVTPNTIKHLLSCSIPV